jgi:hypothetical protein
MKRKIILTLLVIVAIFGLFLMSSGMTGMAVLDSRTSELCESDSDCANFESCCLYHNEYSGVCHVPEMCNDIDDLTNPEYKNYEDVIVSPSQENNLKLKSDYTFQMIIGVFFALIACILFYFHAISFRRAKEQHHN